MQAGNKPEKKQQREKQQTHEDRGTPHTETENEEEKEKVERREKLEDNGGQKDESLVTKGACFCKSVTFTLTGKPELCVYCHCSLCQRITGEGLRESKREERSREERTERG